jgi:hypothetical protein
MGRSIASRLTLSPNYDFPAKRQRPAELMHLDVTRSLTVGMPSLRPRRSPAARRRQPPHHGALKIRSPGPDPTDGYRGRGGQVDTIIATGTVRTPDGMPPVRGYYQPGFGLPAAPTHLSGVTMQATHYTYCNLLATPSAAS